MAVVIDQQYFSRKISTSLDPLRDEAVWLNDHMAQWCEDMGEDYAVMLAGKNDWTNLTSQSQYHGAVIQFKSEGERSGLDQTGIQRILFFEGDEHPCFDWWSGYQDTTGNNGLGTYLTDAHSLTYWSNSAWSTSTFNYASPSTVIYDSTPGKAYFVMRLRNNTGSARSLGWFQVPAETLDPDMPADVGGTWAVFDGSHTLLAPLTCIPYNTQHPYNTHYYNVSFFYASGNYNYSQYWYNLPVLSGRRQYIGHLSDSLVRTHDDNNATLSRATIDGKGYTCIYPGYWVRTDG